MRSQKTNYIEIHMQRGTRGFPLFITLAHRHLQKELPTVPEGAKGGVFHVPTDLLSLLKIDPAIIEEIESVEMIYAKK